MLKHALKILFLISVCSCIYISANNIAEQAKIRLKTKLSPALISLEPQILKIITLGHKGLYDDLVFIWLLQYLSSEPGVPMEPADILYKRTINSLKHSPKIEAMYLLPCFLFTFNFNRPELCSEISVKGLQALPDSWSIPMTQGFVYAFKLKQPAKGAFYYHLASSRPKSPPYVSSLAKKLLTKEPLSKEDLNESLQLMLNIPKSDSFHTFLKNNYNHQNEKK